MKLYRAVSACLLLSCCLSVAVGAEKQATPKSADKWIPLFNGKNLDGWTPKITGYRVGENFGKTFRVKDGLLTVSYEGYDTFNGRFGHLFYRKSHSHYLLRVEYRFIGKQVPGGPGWAFRNSGIMIHSESPQQMTKDQKFPTSIEVQLLGGRGSGKRPTANLCTPGTNVVMEGKLITRHCIGAAAKTYHGDQWVTVELEVRGDRIIKHIIDGQAVLVYNKPQLDRRDLHARKIAEKNGLMLKGGYICLQSESHPVQFRKVELRILNK